MREIRVEELLGRIAPPVEVVGDASGASIRNVAPIDAAAPDSLVWLGVAHPERDRLLAETAARVVVTGSGPHVTSEAARGKVLLVVRDPKLAFLHLVGELFDDPRPAPGVHATAVVDPGARLADDVVVGTHCTIGKVEIGPGCIIRDHVVLRDRTRIGRNVEIGSGCVIGEPGLTLTRDDEGRLQQFPHVGGVVIGDDVTVQALSVIDRGVLADTVIGRGTKINSHVYVAHNSRIGEDNVIIGHTLVCGSVVTGDRCWLGAHSTIRDGYRVGHDVFIGMGSVVVSHLPDGARVMGVPARPIDEAKAAGRAGPKEPHAD